MFIEPYINLHEIFIDEEKAILYMIENEYIKKYEKCEKCNSQMSLYMKIKYFCVEIINVEKLYHRSKEPCFQI